MNTLQPGILQGEITPQAMILSTISYQKAIETACKKEAERQEKYWSERKDQGIIYREYPPPPPEFQILVIQKT